jgi:hypothetical protein
VPDWEVGDACARSAELLSLEAIAADTQPQSGIPDLVMAGSWESTHRAIADPRFIALVAELNQCVIDAGYIADSDSPLGGVHFDSSWDEEQRLRAVIVAATCNDSIALTQQAADIEAEYQNIFIAENQAELLAIRAEAETRIALAHQILREVGLE